MEAKQAKQEVFEILRDNEETRSDDFKLIAEYISWLNRIEHNELVEAMAYVLKNHTRYDLPPFESLTRYRRQVQKAYPEWFDNRTKDRRAELEAEYRQEYGQR